MENANWRMVNGSFGYGVPDKAVQETRHWIQNHWPGDRPADQAGSRPD